MFIGNKAENWSLGQGLQEMQIASVKIHLFLI